MTFSHTICRPQDYGFNNWADLLHSRTIRHDIQTRPDLTRAAKAVLSFLLRMRKTTRWIIFSIKTLAKETHYHPRTVQRACRLLEERDLLIIKARTSKRLDPTSNLYIPTWHPYMNGANHPDTTIPSAKRRRSHIPCNKSGSAAASQADLKVSPNVSADHQPRHNLSPQNLIAQSADAVSSNALPMPGGEVAVRHDPPCAQNPETLEASVVSPSAADPIEKRVFHKNDQPGNEKSSLCDNRESESAYPLVPPLDDVLTALHIQIAFPRLRQWIERFSENRIRTVSTWIALAPTGTIRHPGGWMYRALNENWDAPSWIITHEQRRLVQQQQQQRLEQEAQQRAQEAAQRKSDTEKFVAAWAEVSMILHSPQGSAVSQRAAELARETLKAAAGGLFKPGTIMWKTLHIQAYKELKELQNSP
jgi:hypothetical protein